MRKYNKYKYLSKFYKNNLLLGGVDIPDLDFTFEDFKSSQITKINQFFKELNNDSYEFEAHSELSIDTKLYLISLMELLFKDTADILKIKMFGEGVLKLGKYLADFEYSHVVCIGDSPSKIGYLLRLLYPNLTVIIFPFSYFKTLALISKETGTDEMTLHNSKSFDHKVFQYLDNHLNFMNETLKDKTLFIDFVTKNKRTTGILLRFLEYKNCLTTGKNDIDEIVKKGALPSYKRQFISTQEIFHHAADVHVDVAYWLDRSHIDVYQLLILEMETLSILQS